MWDYYSLFKATNALAAVLFKKEKPHAESRGF
jgi:hypothetical protein